MNSARPATAARPVSEVSPLAEAGWVRTFSSLRNPHYRWLWVGMLFSFMSFQMQQVARGYLAFQLEGTATALGVVSVGWGIPMLLFSLVGGAVADRSVKRNLLLITQSAMAALSLTSAILVHTGIIQVWHLAVLGAGQGTVFSFNGPARQALVPELVAEREIVNAVALNTTAMQLTRVLGPSLAGGLIAAPFVGLTGVFYIMPALYLVVVLTLLRIPPTRVAPARPRSLVAEEVVAGLRYIRSSPTLLALIGMAMIPTLLGMPYMILLPAFAEDVFDVGSVGLGTMMTATGVGAVVGSLTIAYMAESPRRAEVQIVAGVGFGVTLAVFAMLGIFSVSVATLALVGMMSTAYWAINNGLIMTHTQPEYYGRVMSVYMMTWSLMPLAALPMSMTADQVGLQPTMATAGVLIALVVLAVALFYPAYRRAGPSWEGRGGGGA